MSLNKAERLQKEREGKVKEEEEVRLQPPFPYTIRAFDPGFFDNLERVEVKGD
ncbi:MAG: hypothetical protein GY811_06185 [Myxococcales bacterium]|nr:hypothetical protein [Myxococcales bacterium]